MSLLDVHVQLLVKHNYIAYSIVAIQSSNSLKKIRHTIHIRGPTIGMDEGPQGPGTNGLKSGTVLALLRPMLPGKRESHDISPEFIAGFVTWELMKKI